MMRYLILLAATCCLLFFANSCKKEKSDDGSRGAFLEIQLMHHINGQPVQLNTPLTNTFNETFTLTDYKYYISNIELTNPVKPFFLHDDYFLVDEQNPGSKTIRAAVKADSYDAVIFMLGVDSVQQVKAAHSGALDPSHGMFWDANSGYMAAKLEGLSDFSGAPGNVLRYQIGGFEGQYNALRYVIIHLPSTMTIGQGQTLKMVLNVDLGYWFDGIYSMPIIDHPTILAPGPDAMKIADNYTEQFSLSSVDIK